MVPYSDARFAEVFWERVGKRHHSECWPWKAGRFANGYGAISRHGKILKAHRVAFELANGPIPAGKVVCHSCDRPDCCNPHHLFAGTNQENTHDCIRKGRYRAFDVPHKRGEEMPGAKLTADDVRAIRAMYRANRMTQAELATSFGVSAFTVSAIVRRKKWAHIV